MSSKQKGYASVRQCIKYLEGLGYICDTVERTGRFRKYKDLFSKWFEEQGFDSGFDLIAVNGQEVVFVQVTTTRPKKHEPFRYFNEKYGSKCLRVMQYVRIKNKEPRIFWY